MVGQFYNYFFKFDTNFTQYILSRCLFAPNVNRTLNLPLPLEPPLPSPEQIHLFRGQLPLLYFCYVGSHRWNVVNWEVFPPSLCENLLLKWSVLRSKIGKDRTCYIKFALCAILPLVANCFSGLDLPAYYYYQLSSHEDVLFHDNSFTHFAESERKC